jgi:hypothetical protein
LRYDLRGFGNTVCRGAPFKDADDMLALLDALSIRAVIWWALLMAVASLLISRRTILSACDVWFS